MQQAQTSRLSGCVILLLITAAVLFVVDSRWWRDPLGRLRSLRNVAEAAWVLRPIDGPYPSPMSIDVGPSGDVWLTTKYDVYRFSGGDPGEPQVLLDPQIYREQFGRRMNALASAWLTPDGTLWVGSWEGEVLSWQDGRWREVVPEGAGPSGKIAGLVIDDRGDEMWIGAHDGLWHSPDGGRTLELLAGLNSTVNTVTRLSDGRVAAGVWDEVYLGRASDFRPVWRATRRGIAVEALAPRPGGGLLIGTRDGFVELTSDGREVGRELAGSYLTAFTNLDKPGQWVVATWGQGVFVETASGWHKLGFAEGLADDSLTDVLVVDDRVWVGIYGEGVRSGTLTKLAELAESRSTPEPIAPGAHVFANACEAAAALLDGEATSGQVAVERVADRTWVFFNGELVCPQRSDQPTLGSRLGPGELVLLETDHLQRVSGGVERRLPLPAGLSGWGLSALYLDSQHVLWLGTDTMGLYSARDGTWHQHGEEAGLLNNRIETLLEDGEGRLWVGTTPVSHPETGHFLAPGLHRFDGRQWQHFAADRQDIRHGPRGLVYGSTENLTLLTDGRIAVATPGGLSLWSGDRFRARSLGDARFVVSVTEEPDGTLWLTHAYWGAGVSWLQSIGVGRVTSRDGLFEDNLSDIAFDAEGRVWLLEATTGRVGVYPVSALR